VFLDDCRWAAFHQLAPPLRRAGVRTVRISTEARRRTRVASWLLFDRYAILSDPSDLGALQQILAEENVVDIQFAESLAELVRDNATLLRPEVAEHLRRRLTVIDKFAAARVFDDAGVRTPRVTSAADSSPSEAAAQFGLPVVVKHKVGYGGERVSIARDLGALEAAASSWDAGPDSLFYERYIDGTKLNYAAIVSPTGIEQELSYRVTKWKMPVGRASEVETIDDPQLVAFGRKALGVVGCTGMVNMDVIRDADGVDWLIDFNARAFGGSGSFMAAGIDTSQGYLRGIGQRAAPPARTSPVGGVRFRVFPTCLDDLIDSGSIVRTTVAFARFSLPYLRWLGFRYWLSEAFLAADSVRVARQQVKTPGSSPNPGPGPLAITISETPTR
jgi:hypothetical protein